MTPTSLETTLASFPTTVAVHDLKVDCQAPFDIDYPPLGPGMALCIGLALAPRHHAQLHAAAVRDTVAAEHGRAARFLHREDALRHLLGRALLRRVAARYGGADRLAPIEVNHWGKPVPSRRIGCNISHAGSQVWVAVSGHPDVGIDVEATTGQADLRELAAAFHPDEAALLAAARHGAHPVLRCWSRKEAVAKAVGRGLSLALDTFAVDCGPGPSGWLRQPPPGTALHAWTTVDLPVADGYVGALAIDGHCAGVSVLRLSTA